MKDPSTHPDPSLVASPGGARELIEKWRAWHSECWNPLNPHALTCQNSQTKPCENCAAVIQAKADCADELEALHADAAHTLQDAGGAREQLIAAYREAQDNWSAQCFCFTSAPEQLRRDAHQAARDGFNELVMLLGPIVRPWLQAEYKEAEAAAKAEKLHADAAHPRAPRKFSELRSRMSPESQQRAAERTKELLDEIARTTCVYCGQPVEGASNTAHIVAHSLCVGKTAAADAAHPRASSAEIGELVRAYMAESMAMPDSDSDQEQNWIAGHMATFASRLIGAGGSDGMEASRL